jgi:regulatory protein
MVSVVLAADSSSASANRFTIRKTEWASAGVLKVHTAEGPSFFLRPRYLAGFASGCDDTAFESFFSPGMVVAEDLADALLSAGRIFLAERRALEYLARAEHSRLLLSQKLSRKGFSRVESDPALDYLEERGYLDDSRYASAWLRTRSIHKAEGRMKLAAGLAARGIGGEIAKRALDDYCSAHDEAESCAKQAERLIAQGRTGEKLVVSLVRRGFSVKLVKSVLDKKIEL